MEVFFVYGLVPLFFLLLIGFILVFLSSHPYQEPEREDQQGQQKEQKERSVAATGGKDTTIAYAFISLLLALFFVAALLRQRQYAHAAS